MAATGAHLKIKPMGDNVLGVTLEGNPKRPEPDHFRVSIPGGDVDIARCSDGSYWIHVHVNNPGHSPDDVRARIEDARLDINGKHASECNAGDFGHPDLYHVAVKVVRS